MTRPQAHERSLQDQRFVDLYGKLMAARCGAVGNGLLGWYPDPLNRSRQLYYAQRGFYTEALPGEQPVVMALAVNPGTPAPEEIKLARLPPAERVAWNLSFFRSLLETAPKPFFRNLPKIISWFLNCPQEEIFQHAVFTNLCKQSTVQHGNNFEWPNEPLIEHGSCWLEQEIALWRPVCVLALGRKVQEMLEPRVPKLKAPVAFLSHPSRALSNEDREAEVRAALSRLGFDAGTFGSIKQRSAPSQKIIAARSPATRSSRRKRGRVQSQAGRSEQMSGKRYRDGPENKRWAEVRLDYTYHMTDTAFPYPKNNPRAQDGTLRKSFAGYAFAALYEGRTLRELKEAADEVVQLYRQGRLREFADRDGLQQIIQQLGHNASVDEVLEHVAISQSQSLRRITLEVAWCEDRGWMRVTPPA
ncbi:hypothetical protein [Ferruginivarius sediminum]|nr:hypothetical protein [Ferruginivarius sediminum]